MTMQNVVTNQARLFSFGVLSNFGVIPAGAARAGLASRASSWPDDSDMVLYRKDADRR